MGFVFQGPQTESSGPLPCPIPSIKATFCAAKHLVTVPVTSRKLCHLSHVWPRVNNLEPPGPVPNPPRNAPNLDGERPGHSDKGERDWYIWRDPWQVDMHIAGLVNAQTKKQRDHVSV